MCHHSYCHAELRKSDLEVTARHLNEVEAVQHVHLTNIPVWFGLLGDIKDGRTQDRCTRPVVSAYAQHTQTPLVECIDLAYYAAWHQMVYQFVRNVMYGG